MLGDTRRVGRSMVVLFPPGSSPSRGSVVVIGHVHRRADIGQLAWVALQSTYSVIRLVGGRTGGGVIGPAPLPEHE